MNKFPHGIMFHHFHDDNLHLPGQGSISAKQFRKIIIYLKKNYNLLSAEEFISKVDNGRLSNNDITLTFDDALRCQFDIAKPILEEFKIKAFFFVYTNAFKENPDPLEFYRDIRNNFFKNINQFYEKFFNDCFKKFPEIESNFKSQYNSDFLKDSPFYTFEDRKFRFIRDRLLNKNEYYFLMDNIIKDLNYLKDSRKNILFMNVKQLKILSKLGHIVGMHSSSHPTNIDELSSDDQYEEYKDNYEFIKNNLGFKPVAMSHPCGRYSSESLKLLRYMNIKIGFRSTINNDIPRSELEIPREDHINILNLINK